MTIDIDPFPSVSINMISTSKECVIPPSTISKPSVFDRLTFPKQVKSKPEESCVFGRLQFPKGDEELILKGKQHVAKVNIKEWMSYFKITI